MTEIPSLVLYDQRRSPDFHRKGASDFGLRPCWVRDFLTERPVTRRPFVPEKSIGREPVVVRLGMDDKGLGESSGAGRKVRGNRR